jgi:hypothetical protein
MSTPIIFCISNIPTITHVGSHELLIKLTTMVKMPYLALDIQRSKGIMHVTHGAKKD